MADPFAQPPEPTATEAIAAIADELAMLEDMPQEYYQHIMDAARRLPTFPAAWQDDAHYVPGCQAKVWMEHEERDGRLFFAATSDSKIVAGLLGLLLRIYSGRPPIEILGVDPDALQDLGLVQSLSTNRGNGVASMARRIRDTAAHQALA